MTDPRRPRADSWAIDDGYHDALGVWRDTADATRRAVVAAMGGDPDAPPPPPPRVRVLRAGKTGKVEARGDLALEDGRVLHVDGALTADLPLGYHDLHDDAGTTRIIVAPPRCHLPDAFRIWGWAAQLYATRSRESWGIGDLGDLRRLARWSRGLGAGLILLNPLAAVTVTRPQESSPYTPSSRRFRNPLYLRIEDVPGAADAGTDIVALARE
jgi:4-alpha-glucanotransferase